jgi:hypothetical protein
VTGQISDELEDMVSALLRDHVDSHEKLDAVLFARTRSCPIALSDLAQVLRITQAETKRVVAALCRSGLWVQHANEHFSEATDALVRARVDALVRAYRSDSLAVVTRLSRQALRRLHRSAAFAISAVRRRTVPARFRR